MRKTLYLMTVTIVIAAVTSGCKTTRQLSVATNANQQIVKITEMDEGGHIIPLDGSYKVIDLNSTIEINLDKNKLYAAVGQYTLDESLVTRLQKLKTMVAAEKTAMEALNIAIKSYENGTDWRTPLSDIGPFASLIFDDTEATALYFSLGQTNDMQEQYKRMFITAGMLVQQLEKRIVDSSVSKGVYLQMGGFLDTKGGTRAIHIDGFDEYEPEKPFKVERYSVLLSDEQKKELEEITKATQTANNEGLSSAISAQTNFKNFVAKVLQSSSFTAAHKLDSLVNSISKRIANDAGEVKALLEQSKIALQQYYNFIQSYVSKYSQPAQRNDATLLLMDINNDIDNLILRTNELGDKLQVNAANIESKLSSVGNDLRDNVTDVTEQMKHLGVAVNDDLKALQVKAKTFLQTIAAGENFTDRVYDFTEKVKKMSLNYVPMQANLNLATTGKREQGDMLTIKLVKGRGNEAPEQIDLVSYRLYFCGAYMETATGFLFTDPIPYFKRDEGKALFHYAPSYSILLKGFWKGANSARKKLSYHTLWSPGIGLNFTSLDFDANGAFEVGVGGVVTLLRNYVQVGVGVNTYNGSGYYFFGVRLPVGNFTF